MKNNLVNADKKKKLLSNTIMLYLLTFSNYFFGFITVPYQTRILGPEYYGKIGFAVAFSTYFQLLFDFGFILSATEEVSKKRNNKTELGKILYSVNILKLFLICIGFIILFILCKYVNIFKSDPKLFILYFVYVSINSFLPDFLYRGLEQMKIITYRSVFIKLIFTLLIFIFLKSSEQYYLVPLLNIIGSVLAVIFVYIHVFYKLKIKFVKPSIKYIIESFKKSSMFFFSRIATTIYGATNTFILGFIYPMGNILGLYSGSDKIISTAKSAFTPISDSVYPYMVKNKDFNLIKKILKICMPIIILGCVCVEIFAKPICIIILGKEYADAANILRLMVPIVSITLPTYLLGFPTMTPLGISKQTNLSVIIGSICHAILLLILFIINKLNVYMICIATIITESIILIYRILAILKCKNIWRK